MVKVTVWTVSQYITYVHISMLDFTTFKCTEYRHQYTQSKFPTNVYVFTTQKGLSFTDFNGEKVKTENFL